jgi:multiple sugar transport system substrate-binding protein
MKLALGTKKVALTSVALFASVAMIAGCSSTSSDQADSSGNQELTFWSWVPNIDKVVAKWNSTHANIHVTVSKQASGDDLVTKLLTASKAGNPPDLAQAEYQALPTLISANALADISGQVGSLKSKFAAGVWNQVTLGGDAVYAVPQDTAPMMFFYRKDLFAQYGLTVPKTWDDFSADAAKLKAAAPDKYLSNFSTADPGSFAGLSQQAGAKWWSTSGDTWSVGINDAATTKVAKYWGDLVNAGNISSEPSFTPQWNKDLANGTLISWPSAVWAPGNLVSIAPDQKGKWAMAALPQWSASESVTGSWGGGSTAVMAGSKHQKAAAEFATWLNTDPTATSLLITQGGLYPASQAAQASLTTAPDYFSDQADFYTTAKSIADNTASATWGPNVPVAYSSLKDALGKAVTNKSSFVDAVNTAQQAVVTDMKSNGFKVS